MCASRCSIPDLDRRAIGVVGVLALAAALRLLRVPNRWDEVAWLYSAYPSATVDALERGDFAAALTGFTGLHPPLWPLVHAVTEIFAPIPLLWLVGAASCSWLAVAALCRVSPFAGLVLATSAIQLHYAAEVNQYPLAVAWIGLAWAARERIATGKGHWGWLAVTIVGGGWTHALAGISAALAAVTLPRGPAIRALAVAAVCATPLLVPLTGLVTEPGTFHQPPFEPALVLADLRARFGLLGLALAPFAAIGARQRPALAAAWGATALVIGILIGMGIAAPHQFPYLLALGPPWALLVAAGVSGPRSGWLVVGICILNGLATARLDIAGINRLRQTEERAVDIALAELKTPWTCAPDQQPEPSCSGDALYLLAPPGLNDDDKRRNSPVLWRLPPWQAMPRVRPYATLDWADHRHGQPRLVGGHVVYVNDHRRDTLAAAVGAHPTVALTVYEQGRRTEYTTDLRETVGAQPVLVGSDHFYKLSATAR